MAITQTITCDVCGKQKQQVNHWWLIAEFEDSIHVSKWRDDDAEGEKHVCGQECAIKSVSEWLQKP